MSHLLKRYLLLNQHRLKLTVIHLQAPADKRTAYLVRRLQSVQNAEARLVFRLRQSDHITDALVRLHWLRVTERIIFKIAVAVQA